MTVALFCWLEGRTNWQSWQVPIASGGDAAFLIAMVKAYATENSLHFFNREVSHLNAPYSASWNDYPVTEASLLYLGAGLTRLFGLVAGVNALLLIAHLLAAGGFFTVCRYFRYHHALSFCFSILFAFSHYIFWRSLSHIVLSFYWHLPLCLLASWWTLFGHVTGIRDRKFIFGVFIGILCGMQNIYYSYLFLQLMAWAVVYHLMQKKWQEVFYPTAVILVCLGTIVFFNLHSIFYSWKEGRILGRSDETMRDWNFMD